MAQRLETLEDFQRVAKALADPNAKPHEYRVRSFGYCLNCLRVTEYTQESGPEGGIVVCNGCLRCNAWGSYRYGVSSCIAYLTDDMVPVRCRREVAQKHDRDNQGIYFWQLLQDRWIILTQEIKDGEALLEKKKKLREALYALQSEHRYSVGI